MTWFVRWVRQRSRDAQTDAYIYRHAGTHNLASLMGRWWKSNPEVKMIAEWQSLRLWARVFWDLREAAQSWDDCNIHRACSDPQFWVPASKHLWSLSALKRWFRLRGESKFDLRSTKSTYQHLTRWRGNWTSTWEICWEEDPRTNV